MIPKEIIEKAIEGGWKPLISEGGREDKPIVHVSFGGDIGSTLVELWTYYKNGGGNLTRRQIESIALDPSFWQSLGKGLGNKDEMRCDSPKCDTIQCEYAGYKDPRRMYENFCSIIWDGGDTEKFWSDLLANR